MGDLELEKQLISIDENAKPVPLSYQLLERITDNFSADRVIGRGGFGIVYKGILRNGKSVAVKEVNVFSSNEKQFERHEKQFERELLNWTKVKHKNVVRILGYCSGTSRQVVSHDGTHKLAGKLQRFLCLEYIPNESLEEYLEDASREREWDTTFQLIKGICCGLHYLHNEKRINHLDLKPANILLHGMVPKIADFGLSRCFEAETSRTFTRNIFGTTGYVAPEHRENGEISFKSDIYSLGVIMKNLLRGSNDLSDFEEWSQNSLVIDNPQLRRCIEISQLCMDADQHKRPTAAEIIGWLNEMQTENQMVRPGFGHSSNNHSGPSSSSRLQHQVNDVNPGSVQPPRRTSWPELVGMLATPAYDQIYRDCWPDVAVEVHPLGSHILPGFNPKRVRIFIDEHGAVLKTPAIG